MIGKTISHYKILEKLGEGGMGKVYLADDFKLNRKVALKFLPRELTGDSDSKKRFQREAQAAALLNHTNIITVHEVGEFLGRNFIVMEYVEGGNLKQKIDKFKEKAPDLITIREITILAMQICRGLEKAHQANIIHRDIKPANLLVNTDGQIKIMDFGLAKLMDATRLTESKLAHGTVQYMSPEQIEGEGIDHRTDIWSFGVVLYEMVTGNVPFEEEYLQAMFYSILNEEPKPLSDSIENVPKELEKIVKKCLQKKADSRYQTMSEVLFDLKNLKQDLESDKKRVRLKKRWQRSPLVKGLKKVRIPLAVVVLLILFILTPNPGQKALKEWLLAGKVPEQKHIVVLPLNIPDQDPLNRAYTLGTAERIIHKLTDLEQFEKELWVAPSSELQRYNVDSVEKVVSAFKTTLILTVKLKVDGDQLIHTLSLINSNTQKPIKTRTFTYHDTDLSGLQDEIIEEILEMLDVQWMPEIEAALTAGGTSMPGAYNLYLQGIGYLQDSKSEESVKQSINLFQEAIKQDGTYDEAHASLGKAYYRMYLRTKDKALLEKAKNQCNHALEINKNLYSVHITLGVLQKRVGDYGQAIKELQKALVMNPESFRARLQKADINYEQLRKKTKGEEGYKEAIRLRTDYWAGYIYLAYLFYESGRYQEAEETLHKIIDLNPAEIWAYNTLIAIYHRRGDQNSIQKAQDIFERSKKIGPNSDTYTYMGTHLLNFQKRYKDARDMYKRATEVGEKNPNVFALWGNLADSLRLMGGHEQEANEAYEKAVQLVQKKLEKNPDDASKRSSLALYLAKLEEFNQAILEINRALKMDPNDLKVIETSIIVFELSKQRKRALHSLKEFIKRLGAMGELNRNPFLSEFHKDPQYLKLVKPKNSPESQNKGNNK